MEKQTRPTEVNVYRAIDLLRQGDTVYRVAQELDSHDDFRREVSEAMQKVKAWADDGPYLVVGFGAGDTAESKAHTRCDSLREIAAPFIPPEEKRADPTDQLSDRLGIRRAKVAYHLAELGLEIRESQS